jgi:hypothetical protein
MVMRSCFILLLLCGQVLTHNAIAVSPEAAHLVILDFDPKALPPQVKFRGKIVTGARWRDLKGENILLLTQTGKFPTRGKCTEGRCFDAALYAYHYIKKDHSVSLLWRLTDAQRHCPFDLYAGFLHGSLSVTDVDSDGVGESTFVYKLSCRSDVSPAQLKLIMHEGATKYAIRGTTKLPSGYGGGEMVVNPALDKADPALKAFSIEKWDQYVAEDQFEQF